METTWDLTARLLLLLVVMTLTVDPACSALAARHRVLRQAGAFVPLCTTEDGLEGVCTALQACPPMDRILNLFKRGQASVPQSDRLRRETLKCPFFDAFNTPRVCCADESIVSSPEPITQRTSGVETPPVTPAPVTPPAVTPPPVIPPPVTPVPVIPPAVIPPPVIPPPVTPAPVTPAAPTGLEKLPDESVCGIKTFLSRIFGGEKAEIGSWPWVVSIGYHVVRNQDIQWRCAGTLISSRHVITAAHCVTQLSSGTKPAMVRLGELDFNNDPDCLPSDPTQCADSFRDVPIESVHPQDQYKGRLGNAFEHDIAVVRLSRSAEPFTDFVRPICLPVDLTRLSGRADDMVGRRHFIVGWGRSDEFSFSDFTPELQEANIRLVPREQCEKTYNRSLTAGFGSRLCAGEGGGVDTCRGDSGGPLMLPGPFGTHWYLTGVTSFGSQSCGVREAVYTRVHDYLDWIVSKM